MITVTMITVTMITVANSNGELWPKTFFKYIVLRYMCNSLEGGRELATRTRWIGGRGGEENEESSLVPSEVTFKLISVRKMI